MCNIEQQCKLGYEIYEAAETQINSNYPRYKSVNSKQIKNVEEYFYIKNDPETGNSKLIKNI